MFQFDADVIVVGNGPAGIALSAFLSGWHPHYNANRPYPNQMVDERLRNVGSLLLDSTLDQWYLEEYNVRNPNVGLYSDLFDRLMRPEAESSFETRKAPCLRYEYQPEFAVSHIVLGDTEVGGSWNNYDDNMETVSLSNWMDLPVYSLAEWMGGQPLLARLPAGIIREYMHSYVKHLDLQNNFKEYTTVTNITKLCSDITEQEYWRVQGHYANGQQFELTCKRVVLACGRKRHRTLEVEGEMNAMNVVYNQRAMRQLFQQQDDLNKAHMDDFEARPVVVVGDGISAADAITYCLERKMPVLHVFRRSERQLKSTMLSRLSSTVYPEYSKIFDLMLERTHHPCYKRASSTSVLAIHPDSSAVLQCEGKAKELISYRCLVICVGLQTELSMLEDKHDFDSNYQSRQDPSLYAIGSVVGDHFIRYLIGGAFRVAQQLILDSICGPPHIIPFNQQTLELLNCHLQELKNACPDGAVVDSPNIDANNNDEKVQNEQRQNRCFFPRIFCKLLS